MKRSYGALDEFDDAIATSDDAYMLSPYLDKIKEYLNPYFWQWFNTSQDLKIFTVKFLFINYTIRVKHTRYLFEQLFGPEV